MDIPDIYYELAAQYAEQAGAYMAEHGYSKEESVDHAGRVCFYGALDKVMYPSETMPFGPVRSRITSAAAALIKPDITSPALRPSVVISYNDDPATTAEDMQLLFKRIAAKLREVKNA
jgi:hypothetical protein